MGGSATIQNSLLLGSLPLQFMLPPTLPQNFQVPDVNQPNLLSAGMNGQFNQVWLEQLVDIFWVVIIFG